MKSSLSVKKNNAAVLEILGKRGLSKDDALALRMIEKRVSKDVPG